MSTYKSGQLWSYRTRSSEEDSRITILRVEEYEEFGPVIHICVNGVALRVPYLPHGLITTIHHMPFTEEAMNRSVIDLVEQEVPLPDGRDGYHNWKAAFDDGAAGVYTVTVAESIELTEQALNGE